MSRACPLPLLLLLLLAPPGCVGRSGGVSTEGTRALLEQRQIDDPVLSKAAILIEQGEGEEAFERLVERFKSEPQAAHQDVALWLSALALIEDGHRIKAFYYLDQLMDEHTASPLFFPAAQKQYEIADSYLQGKADRALLFFPEHKHFEAVEMLFRLQQRVPGSPLAELALKRTADFYYERGDFDFAEDAYGVYIDRYPRSADIPVVRLKQVFSNVQQYEGPSYDPTPLLDAATQLRQFSADYPELAREQKIPEVLAWIEDHLAEKLMIKADFYARTGEQRASQLLMAQVTQQYPETQHARRARLRLGDVPTAIGEPIPTMPAQEQR